jgi:hypothetical protein
VRCRSDPDETLHADRTAAIAAARAAAERLWMQQRIASEVRVDDEDGRWLLIDQYGDLLG